MPYLIRTILESSHYLKAPALLWCRGKRAASILKLLSASAPFSSHHYPHPKSLLLAWRQKKKTKQLWIFWNCHKLLFRNWTFHEHFKIKCKSFYTLLYSCFIALVHCNITRNVTFQHFNTFEMLNHQCYWHYQCCCGTCFGLVTSHYPLHAEHTQLDYRIIDSVNVEHARRQKPSRQCAPAVLFTPLECDYFQRERLSCQLRTGRRLQLADVWLLRWSERKWLSAVCNVTSVTKNQPGEKEREVKLQNKRSLGIFLGPKIILESVEKEFIIVL